MPPVPPCSDSRAVVIGAGIAGLLTARVLAEHFAQVIILDRDQTPTTPLRRSGVPQGSHAHALFAQGLRAVETLLPGFSDELRRRGGHRIDVCNDLAVATPYGWGVRFPSDLHVIGASRPLIEAVIRDRVLALPQVRLKERHQVDVLTGTAQHVHAVTGRDLEQGQAFEIQATVVVDAAGRGSRLPHWLADLGCSPVAETVIDAHLRYATRLYRLPIPPDERDWRTCYVLPAGPAHPRGGVLAPIEGNRWIATLSGVGADRPATAEEAFLPFARSLATSCIADALEHAEPLTPVVCSNATANRRRHLEQATGLPDNLLVVGDAACTFNPIYAQGMTVAALSALALSRCLATRPRTSRSFAARCHRRLSTLHDIPWLLATTADLSFPDTDGPPPALHQRVLRRHLDRVLAAGTHNRHAQAAFIGVLNMVQHPATLLAPRVMLSTAFARQPLTELTSTPPRHGQQSGRPDELPPPTSLLDGHR
ncbi:NAD(P)/FAD-dependent oxidoreductase [Kitasatospora kifunensis]|uniref:2-polyprenyl-6-methoxyphenol hydroxylase-like FAD-dependent oxidoreductase n=1 Tax=Kitasatospora kifunensis TaxID=58351 RepID=A0A7W7RAS9_KITKI|nr:FAD-dependent monooxygenase [Kitasatospora kifunensis]MBB4928548.1 2-polyprenyl-6-methoxyphenol hydroxylase-like FAD-dependent oxidoreductase [Kitasatospora kifunensis]